MQRIPLAAATAALLLVAAACGGSSATSEAPATQAPASDAPSPQAPSTDGSSTEAGATVDDSILTEQRTGSITVDGVTTPFSSTTVETEFDLGAPTPAVLGLIGPDGADGLVIVPVNLQEEAPTGELVYFTSDGTTEQAQDVEFTQAGSDGFSATGAFDSDLTFDLSIEVGAGSSTFVLDGNRAVVTGDLGSTAFDQVTHLIDSHPEVDTLVLQEVPGSVNDEINVQTGRLVREAGYTTIIPSGGVAASGGVDLFAAGVERIAEPGAKVGIHSWCCTEDGTPVADLPRDDPQHADQLAYFSLMLGDELGPEFYFQTLDAAPFDDIHFMTDAELEASTITTNR